MFLVIQIHAKSSPLFLVWQAPLRVRSAKRRHRSPEWTILSHSYRHIQGEIVSLFDLRSCWIVFIHVARGRPGGFLQFSEGEAVMILLASVSSSILAIWPNRERRRAWTIADRRGCPVVRLEGVDLVYISLGDCPALRAIQEDR